VKASVGETSPRQQDGGLGVLHADIANLSEASSRDEDVLGDGSVFRNTHDGPSGGNAGESASWRRGAERPSTGADGRDGSRQGHSFMQRRELELQALWREVDTSAV